MVNKTYLKNIIDINGSFTKQVEKSNPDILNSIIQTLNLKELYMGMCITYGFCTITD